LAVISAFQALRTCRLPRFFSAGGAVVRWSEICLFPARKLPDCDKSLPQFSTITRPFRKRFWFASAFRMNATEK
jgi:hypothetical protein